MDSSSERHVIGTISNKVFKARNDNECSYVNIAFEQFEDDSPAKKIYEKLNIREFFCEEEKEQVFLTSNASNVISKFGKDKLLKFKVSPSPNPDNKCKFTVYYENISTVPIDDFIEIFKVPLPDANAPTICLSMRPSTRYVMLETDDYFVSCDDVDDLDDDLKMPTKTFPTLQEAQRYIRTNIETAIVNCDVPVRDAIRINKNGVNFLDLQISEELKKALDMMVNEFSIAYDESIKPDISASGAEELVNKFLGSMPVPKADSKLFEHLQSLLRAALHKHILKHNIVVTNELYIAHKEEIENIVQLVSSKIKVIKRLYGPFVAGAPKEITYGDSASNSEIGGYEVTLSVPQEAMTSFSTKDPENSTIRYFDYSALEKFIKNADSEAGQRKYLVQLKNWQNIGTKYDFINDDKLINNYCFPLLASIFKDLKPSHLSHLRTNIKAQRVLKKNEARVNSAMSLIESVCNLESNRTKYFSRLMETQKCQEFVRDYVVEHSSDMLERYQKEKIDAVNKQNTKLKKQQTELENKVQELNKQIKSLTTRAEKLGTVEKATATPAHSSDKTISSEQYNVLKSEYTALQNDYSKLKKEMLDLSHTKEQIQKELQSEVNNLSSRYLDMHSMLKAFTSSTKPASHILSFRSSPVSKLSLDNISKSRNRFVEELTRVLRSMGRDIERNKLVSMIITIAQNQFTVLAGLPGSGKTSFVKCMGKALNLGNRMHKIPVARGWTSQRDILGYWNSLAGMFQAAPTGLWELLNTLHVENNPKEVTPAILLLDEMNLSSPEHYFSSFMDLADDENERRIFTGSPDTPYLHVPDYLHFIGTVNSDDTVNILSPRMLDRSAVILFDEKPSQAGDLKTRKLSSEPMPTYSAQDWMTLFTSEDNPENSIYSMLSEIEEQLYNDNQELGQRIVISYRKHQQIISFLTVAIPMLGNTELALDFATRQFILPMINGMGEGFGNRLDGLLEILMKTKLERSAKILQHIIAEGADRMNCYQFLA